MTQILTSRHVPAGLQLRASRGEPDAELYTELINAEYAADAMPARESVADMAAWLRHANEKFDPARDLDFAELDGVTVAAAERGWVDTTDGLREYQVDGKVRPEWRRRGIGTALLLENERRQRELAATHETDRPKVLGCWAMEQQASRIEMLRRHGYEQVRWFFDMTRPLSEPIPDVPLPDGLEVRPVTMDQVRQIWQADVEAFQDHWGGFDGSDEMLKRWIEGDTFQPELWQIAWDGDEVAGGVVNAIHPVENEALGLKRGWLHSVFTRRAWRKRGLAHALINRSLLALREKGMDYGVLGVDADNPNGALGLYERNGFSVSERSGAWRKPLESDG